MNPFKGLSKQELKLLIVLGVGSFTLMSSLSSINVALPRIQNEFDISLSALKWVSIIGPVFMASLSLCFGRVGDILGRRRVYQVGMLIYALGAGLSATAISFPHLMVMRVFMALGVAIATPLAAAIIASTVAPERRGRVMGTFASFSAAGLLMGPTLGGIILDLSTWRVIFVTNMVLGLILVVAQLFLLQEKDEKHHQSFDYWGAGLLLAGYPALLIALSLGPGLGWSSPTTLACFTAAAVGLAAFFYRESHYSAPLFRLSFFKSLSFSVAMFTLIVAGFVQNPVTLFSPIYLQTVLDVDPATVGIIMMTLPVSTMIAGPIGGRLADRYDPRVIASCGAAITFLAVLAYVQLDVDSPVLWIVIPLALVGFGAGFFRPANQVAVYASIDRKDYGSLSAMLISFTSLSGTLGTTITVAISDSRAPGGDPVEFVAAQSFAFTLLLPLLFVSAFISLLGRKKREDNDASVGPTVAAAADQVLTEQTAIPTTKP